MNQLTVFTPTYNRASTLPRLYESLLRQSADPASFEWLVIDDGSTDGTRALVQGWQDERRISIRYIYQPNGGMHVAHNTAFRNIDSELCVCIDSDDYLTDDAVEVMLDFWQRNGSPDLAGFIGLNVNARGRVVGPTFPYGLKELYIEQMRPLLHSDADKKKVFRTAIIKQYPEYPVFPGEKYVGLYYKYFCIGFDHKFLTLNHPLCVVRYRKDGSGYNMYRQYWDNPRGFAFYRLTEMQHTPSLWRRYKVCAHYVSSSIRARDRHFLRRSPRKALTLAAIPAGIVLYCVIRHNVRRGKSLNPNRIKS